MKAKIAGPHPRVLDSVGLVWSPRSCDSNKSPGAANTFGPETTLWEPVGYRTVTRAGAGGPRLAARTTARATLQTGLVTCRTCVSPPLTPNHTASAGRKAAEQEAGPVPLRVTSH